MNAQTGPQLLQAVQALLQQIVANRGIPQNEYLQTPQPTAKQCDGRRGK